MKWILVRCYEILVRWERWLRLMKLWVILLEVIFIMVGFGSFVIIWRCGSGMVGDRMSGMIVEEEDRCDYCVCIVGYVVDFVVVVDVVVVIVCWVGV